MDASTNSKGRFYAFISHKSTDSKFALKLQKFIETYHLPTSICQMAGIRERRLTPLCSYEVDFSSSPLLDEMHDKLMRSNYLILLCSEELMKNDPRYIDYEIRTFIECKKAEGVDPLSRIIPVVVSGEFGSAEHECCPEALRELGDQCPIALDRRKYKSDRELFLHVISSLLDIDYAVIENRDKKRQRNRKLAWGSVLALLLAVGIALGEYYIPRKSHYVDFVMREGIPEGIGLLDADEYQRMKDHYVITRQKHKVQSLEYMNALGKRIDHSKNVFNADRPSAYRFAYTDEGLSAVTYENRMGQPYFILQYPGGSTASADLRDPYDSSEAFYIGAGYDRDPGMLFSDMNVSSPSDISRFRYEYSPEGYVQKVFFCADSSGRLAQDNSVYGFEYVTDEKGRICETYFLDALGQRRLNSEGIYCRKFTYDERNDLVQWINCGADGSPTADEEGIVCCQFTYDDAHNLTGVAFLDAQGAPAEVASYGGASQKQYVDGHGNMVRVDVFGIDGEPSMLMGYCTLLFTYDDNGYTASRIYLDAEGQAVMDPTYDYAEIRYVNDASGNATERTYHDTQGQLHNNAFGFAREVITYNEMGKEIAHAYFDAEGMPADYHGFGYSSVQTTYDERGRETSLAYFGPEGEPVLTTGPIFGFGYHKLETTYEYGAHTKQTIAYYDTEGKIINMQSSLGEQYATAIVYVQNGDITYSASYRADGSVFGDIMEAETTYSAQAEPITTYRYTDGDGKVLKELVKHYRLNGVDKKSVMTEYDDQGKVVSVMESEHHENGERKTTVYTQYGPDGSVTVESVHEFDTQGNEIRVTLTEPASVDARTYIVNISYDGAGNRVAEQSSLFTADGTRVMDTNETFHPDGSKDTVESIHYDAEENVEARVVTVYSGGVKASQTEYTYDGPEVLAMVTNTRYDAAGKTAEREMIFYGENGAPESSGLFQYHPDGTVTQTTVFYDEQGNVIDTLRRTMDENGNVIG